MGSITSKPKAPAVQQPVIITMPTPTYNYTPPVTTPTAPVTSTTPVTPPPAANDSGGAGEEAKAQARNAGLLDRRRGVLGTVLTGFRGILQQGVTNARKTLLGE